MSERERVETDGEPETERESDPRTDATVPAEGRPDDHLDGVADGCGCAEVWEHLSEQRGE